MTSERNRELIKEWIAARHERVKATDIQNDTPLLKQGLISSLQLLEFIFYIEELTGRAIEIEQIKPGSFQSIDVIMKEFFHDVQ